MSDFSQIGLVCAKCQTKMPDGAVYCPECGTMCSEGKWQLSAGNAFYRRAIIVSLILFAVWVLAYAFNTRYTHAIGVMYLDKWTGKTIVLQ